MALAPTSRQVAQLSLEAAVLLPKGPVLAVQLSRGLQTLTVGVRRGSCPGRESRRVMHVGGRCFQSCPLCIAKDTVPPTENPEDSGLGAEAWFPVILLGFSAALSPALAAVAREARSPTQLQLHCGPNKVCGRDGLPVAAAGASVGKGHPGKWPGDLALPPANLRTRAQRTRQEVREQIKEDEKSVALGQIWWGLP